MSTYKKRRHEPKWSEPSECLDAAKRLGLRNYPSLLAGLGVTPSPIDAITVVRNFCAHSEQPNTVIAACTTALRLGFATSMSPERLIVATLNGRPCVFHNWVRELRTMALLSIR